jgi:hypothetical protein
MAVDDIASGKVVLSWSLHNLTLFANGCKINANIELESGSIKQVSMISAHRSGDKQETSASELASGKVSLSKPSFNYDDNDSSRSNDGMEWTSLDEDFCATKSGVTIRDAAAASHNRSNPK